MEMKEYFCIEPDCNNKISYSNWLYGNRMCRSCSKKGKRNSFKFQYNISKKLLMKEYIQNKKSMSKIAKKVGCSWFTIRYRLIKYQISLRNRSQVNSNKNNPMFGKTCPNAKKTKYKNIWMRSTWETLYAKYLDKNNIKWIYEPKRFNLGELTYLPDFYLPETNEYIEIKGWFHKQAQRKMKLFKKKFPKIKLQILMQKDLQKLDINI